MIIVPDDFPTINEAIQNATDGDTVFIKQGIYNETLVIDKRLTLKGEDTNKSIINGNTTETVILIKHDSVTITGLTIQYSPTSNSPRTYWVRNLPDGWPPTYGEWDAFGRSKNSGYFTRIGDWRLAGIHILGAFYCNIYGNRILDCGLGIWLYKSANNNIYGNELVRNDYGLELTGSGHNNITGNTFSNGGGGIYLSPIWIQNGHPVGNRVVDPATSKNTFAKNNFINNQEPFEKLFFTNNTETFWDNGKEGNYWSDYQGKDENHDGIVDEPYQIIGEYYIDGVQTKGEWKEQVCGTDNYPLMAPFDTTSVFIVYKPPATQPSSNSTKTITTLAIVAAGITIAVVAGLAVNFYYKKRQH